MGRQAKVTYEQIAAVAEALCAANLRPTEKAVRARLGDVGSAGTIHRLLNEWKAKRDQPAAQPFTIPPALQRALSDCVAQQRSAATAELALELAEGRETLADVSLENERQQAQIEEQVNAEIVLRAELATLHERLTLIPRLEAELDNLRAEVKAERQARAEAVQQAAVLAAKLEAALERAVQEQVFRNELMAAADDDGASRRGQGTGIGAKTRRKAAPNS